MGFAEKVRQQRGHRQGGGGCAGGSVRGRGEFEFCDRLRRIDEAGERANAGILGFGRPRGPHGDWVNGDLGGAGR